jgi:hypothetical protein
MSAFVLETVKTGAGVLTLYTPARKRRLRILREQCLEEIEDGEATPETAASLRSLEHLLSEDDRLRTAYRGQIETRGLEILTPRNLEKMEAKRRLREMWEELPPAQGVTEMEETEAMMDLARELLNPRIVGGGSIPPECEEELRMVCYDALFPLLPRQRREFLAHCAASCKMGMVQDAKYLSHVQLGRDEVFDLWFGWKMHNEPYPYGEELFQPTAFAVAFEWCQINFNVSGRVRQAAA